MNQTKDSLLLVSMIVMSIFSAFLVYGLVYMTKHRRDSIAFIASDSFTLPKDANISLPKGYSMRSEYITYSFSTDVYGWYYAKGLCSETVKIPNLNNKEDKKVKMVNFFRNHPNERGVEIPLDGLGICIDRALDGETRAYANKKTREAISLGDTIGLIKMGIHDKDYIARYRAEEEEAIKSKKESWK